ncbi:MAG: ABC-F family ATP-binding cassette domain-containing protein [Bacteroidetes bacterium]|nr:ABC-F family ATP-binding cassette domain-containing protein [Candidatus Colenecus caballi]
MVSVDSLAVEFGAKPLFSGVSYVIGDKDRIALVGKNGAGKSTMLKILAGLQKPTSGSVSISKESSVGYLPQVMKLADSRTVRQEAEQAFAVIRELEAEIARLNDQLAERTDFESEEYHALIERFSHQSERFQMMGGSNCQAELEQTLLGLGFRREDFDRPTSEFSGGWRMRIELAKLLLMHPDILLLDEPTNHLDIESIQWLEDFLAHRCSAVMLVSHDRAFLNNVTTRTIEITCGTIHDYKVKYDQYVKLRAERRQQQIRAYENQQKEIADIKDFIERFRYKPTKSNQVQSRIKALEKIVPIEIDEVDNRHLRLKFPPAQRSGDYPVICDGVAKAYGAHTVFSGVDMTIKRGEKVAFVGRNGEGKSTLVKCIMGEIPFDGSLKIGHNIKIGYYAQNQAQLLDDELTVYDTIDSVAVGDVRTRINDILGAFMFGGEENQKKVKVLSGGERSRLAMIRLLLTPNNLLILDEPTNHLDMVTKDVLKEAILAFDGTVIVVSHDREFLDGLVSKVYEFGDGKVREHLGGIYDFLQRGNMDNLADIGRMKGEQAPVRQTVMPTGKDDYEAQKERERKRKKAERKVADCEKEVTRIEAEIKDLEGWLATPEGAANPAMFEAYGKLKNDLAAAEARWEEAMLEVEGN